MAEDLVSRLLAHLDKVQQEAEAAKEWSSPKWSSPMSAVVDTGDGLADQVIFDAAPVAHFVAAHDPASVVRLVRAHRDIAETYQQQAAALAKMRRATQYGKVPERLPTSDELRAAEAVVDAVYVVLTKLARGYGLQEED